MGSEETPSYPDEPVLSDENPIDGSINVISTPMLSITVSDYQSDDMNVFFRSNASGSWETIGENLSVGDGTYN